MILIHLNANDLIGGYRIEKNFEGDWYYKNADGRVIPNSCLVDIDEEGNETGTAIRRGGFPIGLGEYSIREALPHYAVTNQCLHGSALIVTRRICGTAIVAAKRRRLLKNQLEPGCRWKMEAVFPYYNCQNSGSADTGTGFEADRIFYSSTANSTAG